jgi:gamma-carbonic anhydrase
MSRLPQLFLDTAPRIPASAFVAASADVIGAVELGEEASIWFASVVRADINRIHIGPQSNVQDGAVLHVSDAFPCLIGARVTIGHRAVVHACTVGDEVLIGMGAIVLDGAEIGSGSLIAAGALVTKGMQVPPGSLVIGSPAKVIRQLTEEELLGNRHLALKYVELARHYAASRA